MTYLISTLLLGLVLTTKLFFVFVGKGNFPNILDFLSSGILILLLVLGSFNYFKGVKISWGGFKYRKNLFLTLCLIVLASSFLLSFIKKTVLWDSVALYDARAKFLGGGINFSQMVELSKYDPQNSYYYVLYPPYTSVLHFFWYRLGIPVPVAIIYSAFLSLLAIAVFLFAQSKLGVKWAALLTFLVVSNNVIFSSSISEYTNLPFTLHVFLGIILIYEYLKDESMWKLFYGAALLTTSMWIRFLEPIWLGAALAFFAVSFLKNRFSKQLLYPSVMILYGILEYSSWQSFVSGFGSATKIVGFSWLNFFEPVVGLFTGSVVSILIFFVKSWGPMLFVHLFSIFIAYINRKRMNFLQFFLAFTIMIYYSGLYFVAFQSVWWSTLGGSLVRSSTFMIPISGYLILEYFRGKKN